MQVKRIKHKDIDFKKWDNIIASSSIAYVFAQSFYLNATSPNWDALVIGDYESVFPLTHKSKFGFTYLPQPPFTSQLGAYGKIDVDREQLFYDYILTYFNLIEIELNSFNRLKPEFVKEKKTYWIDYAQEYKFNQNTKRNITKATENGFLFEQVASTEILSLSQKHLNPFLENDLKLSKNEVHLFDNLLNNALTVNQLFTFKVLDKNNNLRALAHFISNGKHTLFLKGTNFDRKENSGSMHFLISHAIEFFKNKSLYFDFGGGSNSEGLAGFYSGLGGEELMYSYLKVNKLPRLIKFLKNKQ